MKYVGPETILIPVELQRSSTPGLDRPGWSALRVELERDAKTSGAAWLRDIGKVTSSAMVWRELPGKKELAIALGGSQTTCSLELPLDEFAFSVEWERFLRYGTFCARASLTTHSPAPRRTDRTTAAATGVWSGTVRSAECVFVISAGADERTAAYADSCSWWEHTSVSLFRSKRFLWQHCSDAGGFRPEVKGWHEHTSGTLILHIDTGDLSGYPVERLNADASPVRDVVWRRVVYRGFDVLLPEQSVAAWNPETEPPWPALCPAESKEWDTCFVRPWQAGRPRP